MKCIKQINGGLPHVSAPLASRDHDLVLQIDGRGQLPKSLQVWRGLGHTWRDEKAMIAVDGIINGKMAVVVAFFA